MATRHIGTASAPVTLPGTIPPAPAVMAILDRFNRDELGNTIEVLVALLDIWDGDSDGEEGGDDEPLRANGDSDDAAWVEWHAMRGSQKRGPNVLVGSTEDDEDDDPAGQYDEDAYTGPAPKGYGACCIISDNDYEHDGREFDSGVGSLRYGIDQTVLPAPHWFNDRNPA